MNHMEWCESDCKAQLDLNIFHTREEEDDTSLFVSIKY